MGIRAIEIPPNQSDQRQRVSLDGTFYSLRFRWNDRAGTWFLDVSDDAGAPIVQAIAVRVGVFGLPYRTVAGMPTGLLMASASDGIDPTLTDLGTRVRIYYMEADTIQEIVAGG